MVKRENNNNEGKTLKDDDRLSLELKKLRTQRMIFVLAFVLMLVLIIGFGASLFVGFFVK
jgi:hypothetical protein